MPSRKAHEILGTATGTIAAVGYGRYIENDFANAWQYAIGGALSGLFLSRIPDFLESSKILGPNHRGLYHGIALNGCIGILGFEAVKAMLDRFFGKAVEFDKYGKGFEAFLCRCAVGVIIGGVGGHTSHLIADSTTPKGLPVFI